MGCALQYAVRVRLLRLRYSQPSYTHKHTDTFTRRYSHTMRIPIMVCCVTVNRAQQRLYEWHVLILSPYSSVHLFLFTAWIDGVSITEEWNNRNANKMYHIVAFNTLCFLSHIYYSLSFILLALAFDTRHGIPKIYTTCNDVVPYAPCVIAIIILILHVLNNNIVIAWEENDWAIRCCGMGYSEDWEMSSKSYTLTVWPVRLLYMYEFCLSWHFYLLSHSLLKPSSHNNCWLFFSRRLSLRSFLSTFFYRIIFCSGFFCSFCLSCDTLTF